MCVQQLSQEKISKVYHMRYIEIGLLQNNLLLELFRIKWNSMKITLEINCVYKMLLRLLLF